jgi:glycine dehydrogenase subunit 1
LVNYIGHTPAEEARLLAAIGAPDFETLLAQVPAGMRMKGPLDLPPAMSEVELRRFLGGLAARNYAPDRTVSFLGAGMYDHAIPAAVDHLALRPEFYTAYTPYQAEVAQGTLAVILEFQTMICELTGLEAANASMYEGASAAAEAVLLAHAATGGGRVLVAGGVSPRIRGVLATLGGSVGLAIEEVPAVDGRVDMAALRRLLAGGEKAAAVLVQQPGFLGLLEPLAEIGALCSAEGRGAHLVVSADPLSLGLLAAPGSLGATTVVGDLQPLGIPPQFGGPSAGYFACRRDHIRRMPGRIAAETVDSLGRRGYTLTLQTREQHIRREKATSNICTNSALMALRACVYLSLLGPRGLHEAASQCVQRSHYALEQLERLPGVARVYSGPFFREFAVRVPMPAEALVTRILEQHGILAGVPLSRFDAARDRELLIAVTEKRNQAEIDALVTAVQDALA